MPFLHKKYHMANTHPRYQYPPGVNTGVPVGYDGMAANNNGIIVNASTIRQIKITSSPSNQCKSALSQ
jgi:hypothetical protein